MTTPAIPVSVPAATRPVLNAQMLGQMADALAWPLLVVWRDGTLVHANMAARRMLRSGQPLQLSSDLRVHGTAGGRQADLSDALAAVAAGRQRRVLHWSGGRAPAGGNVSLTVAPLGKPGDSNRETPLVLAVTAATSHAGDLAAFAAAHGLTASESRVLRRLALGESTPRVAKALGVAQATVRSQTANLRRKTGHRSLSDLVRTLSALPPTVVGAVLGLVGAGASAETPAGQGHH